MVLYRILSPHVRLVFIYYKDVLKIHKHSKVKINFKVVEKTTNQNPADFSRVKISARPQRRKLGVNDIRYKEFCF